MLDAPPDKIPGGAYEQVPFWCTTGQGVSNILFYERAKSELGIIIAGQHYLEDRDR